MTLLVVLVLAVFASVCCIIAVAAVCVGTRSDSRPREISPNASEPESSPACLSVTHADSAKHVSP